MRELFDRLSLLRSSTSLVNASITSFCCSPRPTAIFVVEEVLGHETRIVTDGSTPPWYWAKLSRDGTALVRARATTPAIA